MYIRDGEIFSGHNCANPSGQVVAFELVTPQARLGYQTAEDIGVGARTVYVHMYGRPQLPCDPLPFLSCACGRYTGSRDVTDQVFGRILHIDILTTFFLYITVPEGKYQELECRRGEERSGEARRDEASIGVPAWWQGECAMLSGSQRVMIWESGDGVP